MDINFMTRKDFEALPSREWNEEIECDSIVVLPSRVKLVDMYIYRLRLMLSNKFPSVFHHPDIYELNGMHDSGFRRMDFVACKDGKPICKLSGCSDVVHFDGIGGFGYDWAHRYGTVPRLIPPSGWSMDCLARSGLLRIFPNTRRIHVGLALSSFEIYAVPEEDKKTNVFQKIMNLPDVN
jgi:hypothetical protein